MNENIIKSFDKSGLALLSDLEGVNYKILYNNLEKEHEYFFNTYFKFVNNEYFKKWPKDTLHWWSRIWEYPYVYYHVQKYLNKFSDKESFRILDFGAGVNFFPFAISKLGSNVTCLDIDKLCIESLLKIKEANNEINITPILSKDSRLPFDDDCFNIIYSVSVFEHLPDLKSIIMEIKRVLKRNGILIITFDVSLNDNFELTLFNYQQFCTTLEENFNLIYNYKPSHPKNVLTSENSRYPFYTKPLKSKMKFVLFNYFLRPVLFKSIIPWPKKLNLAVEGVVLEKKY